MAKEVYSTSPSLVTAWCEGTSVFLATRTALVPAQAGLPAYVSSIALAADFLVTPSAAAGLSMTWKGEVLSGHLDAIFVKFAVRRLAFGGETDFMVGLFSPKSATAPGLPPVLEFTGDAIALLTHANTCPLTTLAPARATDNYEGPVTEIPLAAAPLSVLYGYFDPCVARRVAMRNCTDDSEACTSWNERTVVTLTSHGAASASVEYLGSPLEDFELAVHGTFVYQGSEREDATAMGEDGSLVGKNGLRWNGSATAQVPVFGGFRGFATADFDADAGIANVKVLLDYADANFGIEGSYVWAHACVPAAELEAGNAMTDVNTCKAKVTLPQLSLAFSATATQRTCESWELRSDVLGSNITVHGVVVRAPTAALTVGGDASGTPALVGSLTGSVAVDSATAATGTVVVEGGAVKAFVVDAALAVDAVVNGSVSLEVASDGAMRGSASLQFTFDNGVLRLLNGQAEYRSGSGALWKMTGTLASWALHGIELVDVAVLLMAEPSTSASWTLVWSGEVTGKVDVGDSFVSVAVAVAANSFGPIVGAIRVERTNVTFDGPVSLSGASAEAGCAGLTFVSVGSAVVGGQTFAASLSSHGCADTAKGEPVYTLTGSEMVMPVVGGVLTLRNVAFALAGYGEVCSAGGAAACSRKVVSWAGVLTASTDAFGNTGAASAAFSNGAFEGLYLTTYFSTESRLVSGSLRLHAAGTCGRMSTGSADVKLRLAGAELLDITGDIGYHLCAGQLVFRGNASGAWRSPAGTATAALLELSLPADASQALGALGSREWGGALTYVLADGTAVTVAINSSSTPSSVEVPLAYRDDYVVVRGELRGNDEGDGSCTGEGMAVVANLPYGLPSIELPVTAASQTCAGASSSWSAVGNLPAPYVLPFLAGGWNLTSVSVALAYSNAALRVQLVGKHKAMFSMRVVFDTSSPNTLEVTGSLLSGSTAPTVAVSLASWTADPSPLPVSLRGGSPVLYDAIMASAVASISVFVDYTRSLLVFNGTSVLGGVGAAAVVSGLVAQQQDGSTAYALQVDVSGSLASLPSSLVQVAIAKFNLSATQFKLGTPSIPPGGIAVGAVTFNGGFRAVLHVATSLLNEELAFVPSELYARVEPLIFNGRLRLLAYLTSTEQIDFFTSSANTSSLPTRSSRVVLASVAFALRVTPGGTESGFLTSVSVRLGAGAQEMTAKAMGFLTVTRNSPLGRDQDCIVSRFPVNRAAELTDAFGVRGVNIQFPLALSIRTGPTLELRSLELTGAATVAGMAGAIVLSGDLGDLSKVAFAATVTNATLMPLVARVSGCSSCLDGVRQTLDDVKVSTAVVTANAANSSNVTISPFGALRSGVWVFGSGISLWEVVTVARGEFELTPSGATGVAEAAVVPWGPITITSAANSSLGPLVHWTATDANRTIAVKGVSTVWGEQREIVLHFADDVKNCNFSVGIGSGAVLEAAVFFEGPPSSPAFTGKVVGYVASDASALQADATQWLVLLAETAEASWESADAALDAAEATLRSANTALAAANATWTATIDAYKARLTTLATKFTAKKAECAAAVVSKRARCGIEKSALSVELSFAQISLGSYQNMAAVALLPLSAAVANATAAASDAKTTAASAQALVDGFEKLAESAGGSLRYALEVQGIAFNATLTSAPSPLTFTGSLRILGKQVPWVAAIDGGVVSYAEVVKSIEQVLKAWLQVTWGRVIAVLAESDALL